MTEPSEGQTPPPKPKGATPKGAPRPAGGRERSRPQGLTALARDTARAEAEQLAKEAAERTRLRVLGAHNRADALARAREPVTVEALADWIDGLGRGLTPEESAAQGRERLGHVWSAAQLRVACDHRPDWHGRHDAAIERGHVAPLLATIDAVHRGEVEDGSLARARLAAATWRLVRLRPTIYCEPSVRHEVSGPGGGPIRSDVRQVTLVTSDVVALARDDAPVRIGEGTEEK